MIDLFNFNARICPTAGGFLIRDQKILLVKHKKLGFWLAPGGHIEANELPHQAAEREVFEETGVKVKAISPFGTIDSNRVQYIPIPFLMNLHWISKDNYHARLQSPDHTKPHTTAIWPKGCEQHLGYIYLVEACGALNIKHDPNESDGIDWFGANDIASLDTSVDIKQEIQLILKHVSTI